MVRRSPLSAEAKLLAKEIEDRRLIEARARIAKLLAKKRGDSVHHQRNDVSRHLVSGGGLIAHKLQEKTESHQ